MSNHQQEFNTYKDMALREYNALKQRFDESEARLANISSNLAQGSSNLGSGGTHFGSGEPNVSLY